MLIFQYHRALEESSAAYVGEDMSQQLGSRKTPSNASNASTAVDPASAMTRIANWEAPEAGDAIMS